MLKIFVTVLAICFYSVFIISYDVPELKIAIQYHDEQTVKNILKFRKAFNLAELKKYVDYAVQREQLSPLTEVLDDWKTAIWLGITGIFCYYTFKGLGSGNELFLLNFFPVLIAVDYAYSNYQSPEKRVLKARFIRSLLERALEKNKTKK